MWYIIGHVTNLMCTTYTVYYHFNLQLALKFFTRSHWFVAIVCFPEKFDPINKSSRQPSKSDQQQSDNASDTLEIDSEESVGGIVPVVLPTQEQLVSTGF